ncbi:helix-turn-helix domain-containing protein [Streptomyces roseifaciens]
MGEQARCTARRRKLGAALREARDRAGVAVTQAARAVDGGSSKVSRIETGRHRITQTELKALMDLYRIRDEKTRDWLIALASEGRKRTWWRKYPDVISNGFKENLTLETEAARIAAHHTQVIPGLLQTHEYAKAVMSGAPDPYTDEQLERYADFRMARQCVFERDDAPQYACVIPEGVIRHSVGGPDVMAAQLRKLIAASRPPAITIQVLPFTQCAFTCTGGSFTLYSYPDPLDFDVVHIEHLDGELFLEEDETAARYRRVFESLRASALPAQESTEVLASIADALERK